MSKELTTTSEMSASDVQLYKKAQVLAKSNVVPAHYRNNPDNCFVAVQSAERMNIDPLLYMRSTFVLNGNLGMSAQFGIALAELSGRYNGCITFKEEGQGDNFRITASATLKNPEQEISFTVGMQMAIAENWVKNPKYKSMPGVMLRYRAAIFLIRLHTPSVLFGMQTAEELEDMKFAEAKDVTSHASKAAALSDKLSAMVDDVAAETPSSDAMDTSDDIETVDFEVAVKTNKTFVELKGLIDKNFISAETQAKWCGAAGVMELEELPLNNMEKCVEWIKDKYENITEYNLETGEINND